MNQTTEILKLSDRSPNIRLNQTHRNLKRNKVGQNRNDHSLEKKSPIRLP